MSRENSQLSRNKVKDLIAELSNLLARENICDSHSLIINMTPKLQIAWYAFCSLPLFRGLCETEIYSLVSRLQCAKIITRGNSKFLKLDYADANRILLVTGFLRGYIENFVRIFNKDQKIDNYDELNRSCNRYSIRSQKSKHFADRAKIVGQNRHWIAIEAITVDWAHNLKKILRGDKNRMDLCENASNYRQMSKRVRIIIQNEDFFTILIDAISEDRAQQFRRCLQVEPREGLFYVPMAIKMKQLQYEQLDDYDIRSDSTSMNSEIQDNKKKIKDVIETSEQGIQAENSADCWGNNQILNDVGTQGHESAPAPIIMSSDESLTGHLDHEKDGLQEKLPLKVKEQSKEEPILNSVISFHFAPVAASKTTQNTASTQSLNVQSSARVVSQPRVALSLQSAVDNTEFSVLKYEVMLRLLKDHQKNINNYDHIRSLLPDYIIRESPSQKSRNLWMTSLLRIPSRTYRER